MKGTNSFMIRVKNMGELALPLSASGTQSVLNGSAVGIAPFNGFIQAIFARLGTAGTTGTQNTDIQKNGVTIFASGAAAVQFATGSTTPTYGALAAANPVPVTKGDVIKLNTTTIHTTPAIGLVVMIVFRRGRAMGGSAVVETDTLSASSDLI